MKIFKQVLELAWGARGWLMMQVPPKEIILLYSRLCGRIAPPALPPPAIASASD